MYCFAPIERGDPDDDCTAWIACLRHRNGPVAPCALIYDLPKGEVRPPNWSFPGPVPLPGGPGKLFPARGLLGQRYIGTPVAASDYQR